MKIDWKTVSKDKVEDIRKKNKFAYFMGQFILIVGYIASKLPGILDIYCNYKVL